MRHELEERGWRQTSDGWSLPGWSVIDVSEQDAVTADQLLSEIAPDTAELAAGIVREHTANVLANCAALKLSLRVTAQVLGYKSAEEMAQSLQRMGLTQPRRRRGKRRKSSIERIIERDSGMSFWAYVRMLVRQNRTAGDIARHCGFGNEAGTRLRKMAEADGQVIDWPAYRGSQSAREAAQLRRKSTN